MGNRVNWFELKAIIVDQTGLGRDGLHILAGMLIQLAAAGLLRRSLASPIVWLCVAVPAIGNEIYDLAYEIWPDRSVQYAASWQDLATTLGLPTLMLLIARFRPGLLVRSPRKEPD